MKRGIFSLSPIPTIDIMTTFSTEKKNKIKMKKRKKIKLNEEKDIENNLKTEKHFYKKASIFNINWIYWIKSVFDKDRIGFITYNNLKDVNKSIGLNYTDN